MDKLRFILLFVVVLLAGNAAAYDFESGGLYYNILDADAKTVEVTLEGEKDGWQTVSSYGGDIVIPATVEYSGMTYSVNRVGQYAFCRSEITSLTIQEGVETIVQEAFLYCSRLTSVSLPSSLRTIGVSAFFNCYQLEKIVIPEGVTKIGNQAFYASGLKTIELPSTLTEIENWAFMYCDKLTKVISRIQTPFTIDKSVFASSSYTDEATQTQIFVKSSAILCVPEGTKASYQALEGWTMFSGIYEGEPQEITLSDGLIYSYITSEHIANVIGWENMDSDDLTIRSTVEINGENYSVKSVGSNAFNNCGYIRSLTIENGVETIGDYAFRWCYQLESVNLASTITSIGNNSFYRCDRLSSVVLPEGVQQIGRYSFGYCSGLKKLEIPSTIKSIADRAFLGLGALYAVTSYIKEPFAINKNVFASEEKWNEQEQKYDYTPSSATLYVPTDTKSSYEALEGWNMFSDIVEGELTEKTIDGVIYSYNKATQTSTVIGGDFSDYRKVTILGSILVDGVDYAVKTIAAGAFSNNYYIDSLIISSGIETIEKNAFNDSYRIRYLELPSTLTTIGEYAFAYCGNLQNIILPSSLTSIGDFAFCSNNLTNVTSRIQSPFEINQSVFCSGWGWDENNNQIFRGPNATLYVPIGTKSAYEAIEGWSVFPEIVEGEIKQTTYNGLNYQYVEGKGEATVISGNYSQITNLTIPGSIEVDGVSYIVKAIDDRVFSNCYSIDTLIIENGVERIGQNAFYNCSNMKSVSLPTSLKSIGESSFAECNTITSLVIPEGVKTIGQNAFSWCNNMKTIGTSIYIG